VEVVASLSQGRTDAAQCGLSTHKSVPVIFEPPCTFRVLFIQQVDFAVVSFASRMTHFIFIAKCERIS